MAANEPLAPGSLFAGRYKVVALLARGEMGVTYSVDAASGERCLLKVMDASLVQDAALRRKFVAQAKATSKVAGGLVVHTLDAGIDRVSGRPWLSTEQLPGDDLAATVARDGARPLAHVRAFVHALGEALAAAHAQGLVHYDLTPETIRVGPGAPPVVRLCELTVSRFVSEACALEQDVVGSPIWMAPEQFDMGRELTAAANVWTLGLLAFYVATGRPYWSHAHDDPAPSKALLREILRDPIVPASERAAALGCSIALPASFDEWFARCLVRDAGARFADARTACAWFVEHVREVDPAPATSPSFPTPSAPPRESKPPASSKPPVPTTPSKPPRSSKPPVPGNPPRLSNPPPSAARRSTAPPARAEGKSGNAAWFYVLIVGLGPCLSAWICVDAARNGPQVGSRQGEMTVAAPTAAPSARAAIVRATETAAVPYSSPVASVEGEGNEYDLTAALKAVDRVQYGDCRLPSPGQVLVTFAPSGHVKSVVVDQADYDDPTARCVAAKFGAATMPPFRDRPQSVTAKLVATP